MELLLAMLVLPAAAHADLWVPGQMIEGGQYRGVVVLGEPPAGGAQILLSSDNPRSAGVPASAAVRPHSNHGVFDIRAGAEGEATISAIAGGVLLSEQVRVVGRPDGPASLRITLPAESFHSGTFTGYVTVLDGRGAPAGVGAEVGLTATGGVSAPPKVAIPPGGFQAPFRIGVSGDGSLTAGAPGLAPDTVRVGHARGSAEVRVAVAPRVAMEDSRVFYYVWLERDGRPFRPPYAVEAFVHTGDLDVARASPARGDGIKTVLAGGAARGVLYTGERGVTTVTAVAPGIGAAEDILLVGPARMSGGPGGAPELREQDLLGPGPRAGPPDLLLSWIYPPVTDGEAWAVAAAYSSQARRSLSADGVIEEVVLVPARLPGGALHVASGPGLEHRGAYPMREEGTKTNAIEFAVRGTGHGQHSLRASAQGMDSGNEALVRVVQAHAGSLAPLVTPLPALPDARQDLALLSLTDGGAAVDPASLLGRAEFSLSAVSARLDSDSAEPSGGSAVASGVLAGAGSITASLAGVGSHTAPIEPPGARAPLLFDAPGRVHAGEPFPFAVHGSSGGAPVSAPQIRGASSQLGASFSGGMLVLQSPGSGQVSVSTASGAAGARIEAFENAMDLSLRLSGTEFRVGQQLLLEAAGGAAEYSLETELPFERAGPGAFLVTVDREGEHALEVSAERGGYAPASAAASVTGRLAHGLEISASDSRGGAVRPEFYVTADERRAAEGAYRAELRPGPVLIEFPPEHREGGRGYSLAGVLVDGSDAGAGAVEVDLSRDVSVAAIYERRVLVSVEGGTGSGTYGEGQTVRISAPDREVLWFLVREVFERWEGLDAETAEASFAASRDTAVRAVYREDWTYLLLALGAPLAAAAALSFARGSARARWALEGLLERCGGRLGR